MKIKSNKTFECYETAYESWHGGKDITLDGIKLIPITILDKIRDEIEEIQIIGYATVDGKLDIASRAVMRIIDKYKRESEEV